MSAVVETWKGELAKLREKVRAKKQLSSSSSRAQQEKHFAKKEEEVEEKGAKRESKEFDRETTMSESTVCLLMDRFVPW